MVKKIIGLLFLPYLIFMFLEGCWDSQCDRRETRTITDIRMIHSKDPVNSGESIILEMDYESYYVNNFNPDLIPKAYARKIEFDNCFGGFSNAIKSISLKSSTDFDSSHLAGSELNNLFDYGNSNKKLNEFEFESYSQNRFEDDRHVFIHNDSTPTLDSIHTLYFDIYLEDGKTYLDTLYNVNLNQTVRKYYY